MTSLISLQGKKQSQKQRAKTTDRETELKEKNCKARSNSYIKRHMSNENKIGTSRKRKCKSTEKCFPS